MLTLFSALAIAFAADASSTGAVDTYVSTALSANPDLAADRAAWQASVERIPGQRTLPEPRISVGGFVQSVETRVGPQQARLGVQQAIPWPSRLVQSGKAASSDAEAAERSMEATERQVRERVELAYWALWQVREQRTLRSEHLTILDGLAATVRGRLEVGQASLADLQQVELSRSRLEDTLASLDAEEAARVAQLRAAVGAGLDGASTTSQPVLADLPEGELSPAAHPRLRSLDALASSADHRARAASAQRLPDLTVGADWIVTGPARMDGVPDSGKDAVALGVGVMVPLWQGRYAHDVAAARHLEESLQSRRQAREDELQAAVDGAAARVGDSARRVRWVEQTLLPQAQAAYEAVLGEYAVGRAPVSQTLLAQRDLLDLAVDRVAARADHQMQWARLTSLTGIVP
ncbi:MAG: TolC family protein [Myxococcota bacterium]